MFQHRMLQHPRFLALSGRACKALLYLASQYRGDNNGNLQIAPKIARKAGLKTGGNLHRAVRELAEAGFVLQTRQGGRNRCSLYALTWFPIHECGGRHDIAATRVASNDWLRIENGKKSYPPADQLYPSADKSASITPAQHHDLSAGGQVLPFPGSGLIPRRKPS
jgi:hypothetical protein